MSDSPNSRAAVEAEIRNFMPLEEFVRIQTRISQLRQEEEEKLKALAQLQQYYVAATNEAEQDKVKVAVGQIREISKLARKEIRELNAQIAEKMPLEEARRMYETLLHSGP